jgi:hypothetical protein
VLTKTADSKGRVTLGENFANKPVIIQQVDETEVRITIAAVLPERELWLYKNKDAKAAVFEGLEQASRGQFADNPPDLQTDEALTDQLDGKA